MLPVSRSVVTVSVYLLVSCAQAGEYGTNYFQRVFVGQDRMHFAYETAAQQEHSQRLELEMTRPDGSTEVLVTGAGALTGAYQLLDAEDGPYAFRFHEVYRAETTPGQWQTYTNTYALPRPVPRGYRPSPNLNGSLLFDESFLLAGTVDAAVNVTVPTGRVFRVSQLTTTKSCGLVSWGNTTVSGCTIDELVVNGDAGQLRLEGSEFNRLSVRGEGDHVIEDCWVQDYAAFTEGGLDLSHTWFGERPWIAGRTLSVDHCTFARGAGFATPGNALIWRNLFQGTPGRTARIEGLDGTYDVEGNVFACELVVEGSLQTPTVDIRGNSFIGRSAVRFVKASHVQDMPGNYWGGRAGPKRTLWVPGYASWMSGYGGTCPHVPENLSFETRGDFDVSRSAVALNLDGDPFPDIWIEDFRAGQNTLTTPRNSPETLLIREGRPILVCYDIRANQESVENVRFWLEANGETLEPENPDFEVRRDYGQPQIGRPEQRTLNFIVPPQSTNELFLSLHMDTMALDGLYDQPGQSDVALRADSLELRSPPARKLRIGVAAWQILAPGYAGVTRADAHRVANLLRTHIPAMWPVSAEELEVDVLPMKAWKPDQSSVLHNAFGVPFCLSSKLTQLLYYSNYLHPQRSYDMYVGVVPQGAIGGGTGVSYLGRRRTPLVDASNPIAAMHELGHALGLYAGAFGTGEQYDLPDGPDGKGNIIDYGVGARVQGCTGFNPDHTTHGVDIVRNGLTHFISGTYDEFSVYNMTYDILASVGMGGAWCTPSTLESVTESLVERLGKTKAHTPKPTPEESSPGANAEGGWERMLFTGTLERDDGDGSYRFVPGTLACTDADVLAPVDMNHYPISPGEPTRFEAYDAAGAYIRGDECERVHDDPDPLVAWSQVIAVETNVAELRIARGAEILFRQFISVGLDNALSGPPDGTTLGDQVTLSWAHAFAGAHHSLQRIEDTLFYSADGGAIWMILEEDPATNALALATDFLPVSDAIRFKLVTSDGFQAVESEVGTYRMANRPPQVKVLAPLPDSHSVTGVPWRLAAEAWDVEDGPLSGGTWSSSIDGPLGWGSSLETAGLSPGIHTLTYRIEDASGAAATAIGTAVVAGPDHVDLIVRESDLQFRVPGTDPVFGIPDVPQRGVANLAQWSFVNQGVTNASRIQVFYTPPGGVETQIHSNLVAWGAFETYRVEHAFTPTGQGTLQFRAVVEPVGATDADPADNARVWAYANQSPTANAGWADARPGIPAEVNLGGFDPDGDALVFTVTAGPTRGTLSGTPPHLRYTATDPVGNDSLTFTVSDGVLTSPAATVILRVEGAADSDQDGLTDLDELDVHGTDATHPDTDRDGLADGEEILTYGSQPLVQDSDGDELDDGREVTFYGTDPARVDSDADLLRDGEEARGYAQSFEPGFFGPAYTSSGDASWQVTTADAYAGTHSAAVTGLGLNTLARLTHAAVTLESSGEISFVYRMPSTYNNARFSFYVDGALTLDEIGAQDAWRSVAWFLTPGEHVVAWEMSKGGSATDPADTLYLDQVRFIGAEAFTCLPAEADTDGDTLDDGAEVYQHGTDPRRADSDQDGLEDSAELQVHGTNPLHADSDGDGLVDGDEVLTHGSNPLHIDSDGDGLEDGSEVHDHGTDPTRTDTDGDGLADNVELGTEGGGFVELSGYLPGLRFSALAWGDYDQDDDLDLAICGAAGAGSRTLILRNEGDDIFRNSFAGLEGVSEGDVAWVDVDNDRDLDLAVMGIDTNMSPILDLYLQDPGLSFRRTAPFAAPLGPGRFAWGDYDADGNVDVFVMGKDGDWTEACLLYRNDGAGGFTTVATGIPGLSDGGAAWADIDGDRDLDLAVTGHDPAWEPVCRLYRNDGPAGFTLLDIGLVQVQGYPPSWHDVDGNGHADLLLSGQDADFALVSALYLGNGMGAWVPVPAAVPARIYGAGAWAETDGDGRAELVLTGQDADFNASTVFCRREQDGSYSVMDHGLLDVNNGDAAWGDYDGDGDPDLALTGTDTNWYPATRIYRNDHGGGGTDPTRADTDGDGHDDGAERLIGTDPTDPASVWSLRLERRPGGVVVLSWPAVTGKVLRVQHAPSLSQPFQAMGPEWQPTPPENVVTNPASGREGYYRVQAE